ncbi:hypothetical protein N0V83_010003 [Neocucurbitaria cava]|uniref:Uncharacterized protein n=1 Tax=Neocucurbitaria cava TaxID=798079 RepID=A0A9W8Y150_9PLEO|nr:hypothetical protein N0V83_010003 [Neocucurbitaria cava]
MKITFFFSASAMLLRVVATKDEPSLADALKSLMADRSGIRTLGRDGVLRRLNNARDAVTDYVQLSATQIAEFTERYSPATREIWAGVDGRAVTDESQLWHVPDDILPINPTAMTPKPKTSMLEVSALDCRKYACETPEECQHEYNCAECDHYYECVGGPTGCLSATRCDDTL